MSRDEFFDKKLKMAFNFADLTGRKFGELTVLKLAGRRIYNELKPNKGTSLWLCLCNLCNKEVIKTGSALKSGGTTTCGNYLTCQPRPGRYKKGFRSKESDIDKFAAIRSAYKTDAKRRGYSFELTNEEFDSVIIKDCVYCGAKTPAKRMYNDWGIVEYTGIDRLNNHLGYTISNSVPCCKNCNSIKKACTPEIIKIAYKLLFGDKHD